MAKELFMRTVTPASDLPVSLATIKKHIRVSTGNAEDDVLSLYAKSAATRLEGMSRIRFRTQTIDVQYSNGFGSRGFYLLPFTPIQSIVSVKIDDIENGDTVVDPSHYVFDGISNRLKLRSTWPGATGDSVTIRAVAGYATESAIPNDLVMGFLYVVADLYRNRGDDRYNLESGDGYLMLLNGVLATYFDGQWIETT